ncbi:DUF3265 domain-containing protein [Vibrio fluvialis]|nr:DUF3265 domain-containing protein [Vibrio fluvialis]
MNLHYNELFKVIRDAWHFHYVLVLVTKVLYRFNSGAQP